jgi:Flp pilus assembly protein TadG
MRSYLRRKLAELRRCKSGNAVMLTALGLPVLLGATGYGVDTAQYYMYQRELQHAVDQAAIGGAWALVYDEDADYEARALTEYDQNQSSLSEEDGNDAAPDVSLADFGEGTDNSVLVSVTITRDLTFTSLLLNRPATITARAQAAFEEGGSYKACLITISDENTTTFSVGGSATVIANCGLAALSCGGAIDPATGLPNGPPAIVIDGSATVETEQISTCGTADVPPENEGDVKEGLGSMTDAYSAIPIPEPDDSTPNRTYECNKGKDKTAAPQPGVYGSIVAKCKTTFASGIYFIDGGTLDLSTNDPVVGINVMFVLRNGATVKLGGEGGTGNLTLTPMEAAHFLGTSYADDADALSGMLIIEDKTGVDEPVDHQINGNATVSIEGVVYLPNGNMKINGTSDSVADLCFQISAWTLEVKGNAYLKTLCETDETTEVGGEVPNVRLIA